VNGLCKKLSVSSKVNDIPCCVLYYKPNMVKGQENFGSAMIITRVLYKVVALLRHALSTKCGRLVRVSEAKL
jgi:hypothetical protein